MTVKSAQRHANHAHHVLVESGLKAAQITWDPSDRNTGHLTIFRSLAMRLLELSERLVGASDRQAKSAAQKANSFGFSVEFICRALLPDLRHAHRSSTEDTSDFPATIARLATAISRLRNELANVLATPRTRRAAPLRTRLADFHAAVEALLATSGPHQPQAQPASERQDDQPVPSAGFGTVQPSSIAQFPIYELSRGASRPSSHAIDRIGGVPRGVSEARWPRSPGGDRMLHLLTVEVRDRAVLLPTSRLRDFRAIAVFVSSLVDFPAFGEGEEEAAVLGLSDEDLENVPKPRGRLKILKENRLNVEPLGTLQFSGDESAAWAQWKWANPRPNDVPLVSAATPETLSRCGIALLEQCLDDNGTGSYLGGLHVNPSAGLPREELPSSPAGNFLMRLGEKLFSPEANFAGGGWLFVHENDAWAEQ